MNTLPVKRTFFATGLAAFALWGLVFLFSLLTPMMADNYLFSRHSVPNFADIMAGAEIKSLSPMTPEYALSDALTMYGSWCGRFLGNFFVYSAFILPPLPRALVSSLLFVLLCILLHLHLPGRSLCSLRSSSLWLLAGLLWVSVPSFGSAFFWVSVGGLPAILAQLLFLLPYRNALEEENSDTRWYTIPLLFFLGLATASLDYASSAAMPVAALSACLFLFWKRRAIPWHLLAGFFGVSLGAALTLLAPGNYRRLQLTSDPEVLDWLTSPFFERLTDYIFNLPKAFLLQGVPCVLCLWALCTLISKGGKKSLLRFLPPSLLLYASAFGATLGAYFFTAWPPARAFATTSVQLLLLALTLVATLEIQVDTQELRTTVKKSYRFFSIVLLLFCLYSVPKELWYFYTVHTESVAREQIAKAHRGEDVLFAPLSVRGDHYMVLGSDIQDITYDRAHWINKAFAAYYGLKSVALNPIEDGGEYSALVESRFGQPCRVEVRRVGDELDLLCSVESDKTPSFSELSLYYLGNPGLITIFPQPLVGNISDLLERKEFLSLLVPLLLARADVTVHWEEGLDGSYVGKGKGKLWGAFPKRSPFWLVKPGNAASSFDLFPLLNE